MFSFFVLSLPIIKTPTPDEYSYIFYVPAPEVLSSAQQIVIKKQTIKIYWSLILCSKSVILIHFISHLTLSNPFLKTLITYYFFHYF